MVGYINTEEKPEDWMQKKWRPAMGWMYMGICFCDMVIFPITWNLLQAYLGQTITQWHPLTLQGAGLFHVAMGAVLGITAWGRTQEKVAYATTASTSVGHHPAPDPYYNYNPVNPTVRHPVRRAPRSLDHNELRPGQSPKFTDD